MKLPVSVACHMVSLRVCGSKETKLTMRYAVTRDVESSISASLGQSSETREGDSLASEGLADDAVPCNAVLPV